MRYLGVAEPYLSGLLEEGVSRRSPPPVRNSPRSVSMCPDVVATHTEVSCASSLRLDIYGARKQER